MSHSSRTVGLISLCLPAFLVSCSTMYYDTMEAFGYEKRDILVDRIKKGRDDQEAAKKQFLSALEQFKAVTNFEGGDLEDKYDGLRTALSRSEARATDVTSRIESIEKVSSDLFSEWGKEIDAMSDANLRERSKGLLADTRERYERVHAAMERAAGSMEPVLVKFRDQVTFLKHNLNAQAVAALQGSLQGIETDVGALIQEMEASIAEADSFIKTIGTPET